MSLESKRNAKITRAYWECKFPSQIPALQGSFSGKEIYSLTLGQPYHPPIQYRVNFVKFVIKQLESKPLGQETGNGDEVDLLEEVGEDEGEALETWYECLEELSKASVLTEPFYRLYSLEDDDDVSPGKPFKIYEDEKAFVSDGSTGLITWRASLELSKWLASDVQHLTTDNGNCCSWALELGCGTGLLAVAIMTKFPDCVLHYFATDVHNGVLERCRQNVEGNQLNDKIDTLALDWVKDESKFSELCQKSLHTYHQGPGILLGADVIFDVTVMPFLTKIVKIFLNVEPTGKVYFSSAIRNEATFHEFKCELKKNQLEMEIVHEWDDKTGLIIEVRKT